MDWIVKEELWRTIGVFFFAMVVMGNVMEVRGKPLFVLLGIPLTITAIVFSAQVYRRKNEDREFKAKPGSMGWKLSIGLFVIGGIVLVLTGVRFIPTNDKTVGILSLVLGLYCINYGLKEIRNYGRV